ncbi:hypothetical protein [Cellulomonas rhizosphaerae]|uniref:Uncharacterized protein n=1 Tax=Cellulomonas rhizosphaerae TaxID=2293719 RepID=A0A413RI97_9CELL|nr:hypothetical protein [Cellulomonas rhizosphaerae]RHA38000.1 hypothetical protein D1825_15530 [Cellulomonas rhizosphaerae]
MNDPLHRALSDAEASDEAAGYTVPVALVRSRVRRRRAVRAGGVVGVAALAVVAVVVATPSFLPRTPAADPPIGPAPGVVADWPAQFDRCGKQVDDVLDEAGGLALRATLAAATGNAIAVHTTMAAPESVTDGWIYGTELTVVDSDGVVVGVQEGPSVPALDEIDAYYANVLFGGEPFPLESDDTLPLVSCEQYPSGNGSIAIPAGSYRLWVTQTVGYSGKDVSGNGRASTDLPLVVGAGGEPSPTADAAAAAAPPADDLFACGRPVDVSIHALPDAAGLVLAADTPESDWSSTAPPWSVTLGASGGRTIDARTDSAGSLALVDDGVIVGFVVPGRGALRELTVGPDATAELDGPTLVVPCGAAQLRGSYVAWPYVVAQPTRSVDADGVVSTPASPVVVVANPRQVTFGL